MYIYLLLHGPKAFVSFHQFVPNFQISRLVQSPSWQTFNALAHGRIKTLSAMQRCQISWLLSMQHHFIELHPVSAPRKTLSPSVGSKQLPFRTTAATTTKFTQQSITVAGAVLTKTKSEWAN